MSFFGRNDIGTADLQSDPYQEWVHRLERSIPYFGGAEGTPFERFLLLPEINVVGTTEAEVEAGAGAHRPELTVAYPDPVAQADAVVVSSPGAPAPARAAAAGRDGRDPPGQRLGGAQRRPAGRPSVAGCPPGTAPALGRGGPVRRSLSAVGVAIAVLAAAGCTSFSSGETAPTSAAPASTDLSTANPGDCITVDVAVSPEKIVLLTELAQTFNDQRNTRSTAGACSSGRRRSRRARRRRSLAAGWADPAANGPQPVIWSPASSGWGSIVNQRLADRGSPRSPRPARRSCSRRS